MGMKGWKLTMSVTEPTATTLDDYNLEEEVETEESTGDEDHHPEARPSREQNDEPTMHHESWRVNSVTEWFLPANVSQSDGGVRPSLACTLIAVKFASWLLTNKPAVADGDPTSFIPLAR